MGSELCAVCGSWIRDEEEKSYISFQGREYVAHSGCAKEWKERLKEWEREEEEG